MKLFQELHQLQQKNESFVLVILTHIKGSAPQDVGAKIIVTERGLYSGTIGGGKIEAHCIKYAQSLLQQNGSSVTQTWNLQKDIGMTCGGEVSVYFDVHCLSAWNIAVFGAGHISQELCQLLKNLSCRVSVFDTREYWLEKLPSSFNIEKHLCQSLPEKVSSLPHGTFLLSMTSGHAIDLPVIQEAYRHKEHFPLIGMIGSEIKAKKVRQELIASGYNPKDVALLDSPLGLPIGNNTPPEIAISIAAHLIAKRDHQNFTITKK